MQKEKAYQYAIIVISLACLLLLGGIVFEWITTANDTAKYKKAIEASNERIKAITLERDKFATDAAEAKGREQRIAEELEKVNKAAEQSETKLQTARKDTGKAKDKYENNRQVVITDNRDALVKRDELRARLAKHGIIVKD